MRTKLSTFEAFAESLFPHELDYLVNIQQFRKPVNIDILKRMQFNSTAQQKRVYDATIDKRSYSYVKNWVEENLVRIDVDVYFNWLIETERSVLTDSISPAEEAEILSNLKQITPVHYYFIRFYELLQYYRDYLTVRNRTRYSSIVLNYLDTHEANFSKALEINRQLDRITAQIVKKENLADDTLNLEYENNLKEIFFDERLDGYTRYRAIVRLTIYYYNLREFSKQAAIYDRVDDLFRTPLFYSRRIMANYYANRAMMHNKLNQLAEAEKFGYLSIRNKNSDYLFYLINLCGILLKQKKNKDALTLMRQAIPELKKTNNNYYKIGFVSFYLRSLMANNKHRQALDYANEYFDAYKNLIFEHRWHLFFTAYFEVLINREKFTKIITLNRRYNLIALEKQRLDRADYLPVIQCLVSTAEYFENIINKDKYIVLLTGMLSDLLSDSYRARKIISLLNELSKLLPEEIRAVKKELRQPD